MRCTGCWNRWTADSSYLMPTEYKIFKERPHDGRGADWHHGFKAVWRLRGGGNVLPDSPADQEKLTDGDVMEAIDSQPTQTLSLAVSG